MSDGQKRRRTLEIFLAACVFLAVLLGIGLGVFIAQSRNIQRTSTVGVYNLAMPSQILDRNGRLITELFGDEKRDVVPLDEMPKYLVYALITREDSRFFRHHGFSLRGLLRAAWNIATGQYVSGGSTITQQLAGTLYADRSDRTLSRKVKELWWALQLEHNLTKNQILELYMNEAFFGSGTHGVEAASQFYFGHSVRDITVAEAAMLVIQLANPARYSPIRHPDLARKIQRIVLDKMVRLGYASKDEVDRSFGDYWSNYDYTRPTYASAFEENTSEAPYFSEYVRQELDKSLFGKLDYFRDGLIVHTTLNLDYQKAADEILQRNLKIINANYKEGSGYRLTTVNGDIMPVVNLLTLSFDLMGVDRAEKHRSVQSAQDFYVAKINPILEVTSQLFGLAGVKNATRSGNAMRQAEAQKTTVEDALITIDNTSGEILAMVGGSNWETSKFNRAVDGTMQPGSSIKPLYYSAAISSGKFTPATRIYDGPIVFYTEDGKPYTPSNFLGEWNGSVLLRTALADSINVPSLEVLNSIGFDAAIDRMSKLLGMEDQRDNPRVFPHVYPLGLGVMSVAPINMARAYATFANQGQEVDPVAIQYIEDRNGNIIQEPEKELRAEEKKKGRDLQILSPQAAYMMVSLLQSTFDFGTLAAVPGRVGGFDGMPMAGKTGTTQNWSDAWTVGFSPYYTTALWFGFDKRGATLGVAQTGATSAGPVWGAYMKTIHKDLPRKDFIEPDSGLVHLRVDSESGLLPTSFSKRVIDELFLAGTEPKRFDTLQEYQDTREEELVRKLQESALIESLTGQSPDDTGSQQSASAAPIQAAVVPPDQNGTSGAPQQPITKPPATDQSKPNNPLLE